MVEINKKKFSRNTPTEIWRKMSMRTCRYFSLSLFLKYWNISLSLAWVVNRIVRKGQIFEKDKSLRFSLPSTDQSRQKYVRKKRKHHSKWVYVYSLHDISITKQKVFLFFPSFSFYERSVIIARKNTKEKRRVDHRITEKEENGIDTNSIDKDNNNITWTDKIPALYS